MHLSPLGDKAYRLVKESWRVTGIVDALFFKALDFFIPNISHVEAQRAVCII